MSDILADIGDVVNLRGGTYSSSEVIGVLSRAAIEIEQLRSTVELVWNALGIRTYEQAGGKTIWELVADLKAKP